MKSKILALSLFLAALTGVAASTGEDYVHGEKLHLGDSIEINDYVIEYKTDSSSDDRVLRVGRWTGTSFRIIEEVEGSVEIYESEGETFQISENISMTLERTGYDRDGSFVDLNISASKDIFSSGELSTTAPGRIIVSRGESADVDLTLENTGYLNQSYSLGAVTNSSLTTTFSFQDFNVTDVYVPAGEEESITAKIRVPEETRIGTHTVELEAENYTRFSESIKIEVKGAERDRELSIDVEQIYKEVRPGQTAEFYVEVRNHGEARLEDVNITATSPEGWDHEIEEGFIEELRNRFGRERVRVTVEAPQDADPGDYMMEVSAESRRTSIEEPKEVRLHVRQKSGLTYIGAVLMGVSLLILAVVYRKFQRR